MANVIIPVLYRGDDGRDYVTGVDSELYNQATVAGTSDLGGSIPAVIPAGTPPLPSSVRKRRVYMKDPLTGKGRYVTALTPTARIYTTSGATLELEDSDGAASTFRRVKQVAENFGRSRI